MGNFSTKIASAVGITTLVATSMSASLVSAASEFLPYADALASKNVINKQSTEAGYRLNDKITRAELAKVAVNLGGYTPVSCTGKVYTDVKASLGDLCDAIETLAAAKVVSTNTSTFHPLDSVTRAEMTKMLLGALAETPSNTSAGYKDVTSKLGDLEGFINRANEMGCVRSATYFHPNANGSRGEVFKIASCAAGIVVTPNTNTGSTNTGSTTVNTGNIELSLVGGATAQYVPKNAASVKVATIKAMAKGGDVTLNTITISRSGLGAIKGLQASLAQNGVLVGNARSFNSTTQESVIRLNTPVVLKAGQSVNLDVLVSLPSDVNATPNSQHQFAITAVNGTAVTATTLGLINTTSYEVGDVQVSKLTAENVKSGLTNARIANISLVAPSARNVTIHGFTISKNTGNDLSRAIANVKVYRNGVEQSGATATVTSDKIVITGLETKLESGATANYELRADTIYVGDATSYNLYIANTEDVAATEDATGYATRVTIDSSANDNLEISGIKVTTTLVDTTTKNVAPGASSVNLLDGKVTSSATFEVRSFELTPTVNGAATTVEKLKEIFSSLSLDVAGSNYDLLSYDNTTAKFMFGNSDSFIMDAGTDSVVRVRGTVKSNVDTNTYKNVKFAFKVTGLKNLDNGNSFTPSTDVMLNGNNIDIRSASLEVRNATVAAPSTRNVVSNKNGVEIGRFGLQAKNADVRVSKVVVENAASSDQITNLKALADNASSFHLVNLADNSMVDSSVEFAASDAKVEFTFSPAITINKDTIQNYKLTVDTKNITEMNKKFQAKFTVVTGDVSTDNGSVTLTSGEETGVEYVTAISMPTLKVAPVALDANSPVATVTVTNNDSDNNVQIKTMKVRVQARSTSNGDVDFSTAKVCLRNRGATVGCTEASKVIESTAGAINGAALEFTFSNNITAGNVISTNSSTDFDVYLDNAPLWVAGDYVGVSVEAATYQYATEVSGGNLTSPEDAEDTYVGLAGASATATK